MLPEGGGGPQARNFNCAEMSMNDYKDESVEIIEEVPVQVSLPTWLMVLLVLMVAGTGYLLYATQVHYTELVSGLDEVNEQFAMLDNRTIKMGDNAAALQAELDVTSKKLGITQSELKRARSLAQQNRKRQRQIDSELAKTQDQVAATATEVATVLGDVEETQATLEETMRSLERTMGDLGIQSGLIARNESELDALKKRGLRDIYDFDLQKSKRYTRVGDISLRLNRTDPKRGRYTLTVLADDKKIEKKDKTLLEPVQFYQRGSRNLFEIVVFEISKDRVVGYVSAPKEFEQRSSN